MMREILPENDELSEALVGKLTQQLRARREVLRWIIHDSLIESKREDYIMLAGQVHDTGDESVANLIEGLNIARLSREVAELADVEGALDRIRAGTYGTCMDCGVEIAIGRLEAWPTARCCTECQTRRENQGRGAGDLTPSL